MNDNWKNILTHLSPQVDQELLLQYLQGKLTEEQRYEIEKLLIDNDFESDAQEGLQQVTDKKQIRYMVDMLNRDLQKKIEKKKARREKLKLKEDYQVYIVATILILLIIISYFIIRRLLEG